jgi:hypothetical protein
MTIGFDVIQPIDGDVATVRRIATESHNGRHEPPLRRNGDDDVIIAGVIVMVMMLSNVDLILRRQDSVGSHGRN